MSMTGARIKSLDTLLDEGIGKVTTILDGELGEPRAHLLMVSAALKIAKRNLAEAAGKKETEPSKAKGPARCLACGGRLP